MRCTVCDELVADGMDCDLCESFVCEDCVEESNIDNSVFCSSDCREEYHI